ncbi:MAG TPA: DNA methyltransferase [Longimicrobium sp.]|jgi:DNA modification methylase|uniref:DNA methyltransferase n=1 Tax=Longimicrobium sp. TaxID=2029185 RepID=UPI002EDB0E49
MNTQAPRKKRPRKPLSEQGKPGRYDERNTLNDLTGKEWLLLTQSFWTSEPSADDRPAYEHPAPFMVRDVEKLIRLFTKRGMTVLDPFVGSGTTLLAASRAGRRSIGIDLNPDYLALAERRLGPPDEGRWKYLVGDAAELVDAAGPVDYVVTSPPYHNILRNTGNGLRSKTGKQYRMAARDGVEYYTEHENDLGNCDSYPEFIRALRSIMAKVRDRLVDGRYCTIIMSDFTVDKREVCVQADLVVMMTDVGFEFCGTTVLLQTVKPLFPFGYPFAYKINHHHQNMLTFRKS